MSSRPQKKKKIIEQGIGWWFNFIDCQCKCQIPGERKCNPRFHGWISTKYNEDISTTMEIQDFSKPVTIILPMVRDYIHEPWIRVDGVFERGHVAKELIQLHQIHNLNTLTYWHDQGCGCQVEVEDYCYPYNFQCGSTGSCIDWIEDEK